MIRHPSVSEGNPLYPLPADYPTLSRDGQRAARQNAVFLQETPDDLVWAWKFFREHYLLSLPPGDWYKPPVYPSPACHYRYLWDLGAHSRNVLVFPRAYGKTTLINELLLLMSAAASGPRHGFTILVLKATDGFCKETGTRLQFQWEYNTRFVDDFGELRPRRNEPGSWSKTQIWLRNGFRLDIRSVSGKLPGYRPNLWVSDDAEYDPTPGRLKMSPEELRIKFEYLTKNHLIPMLDAGCAGVITTTLYNRKMYSYHLATEDPAVDPSVEFWNRWVEAVIDPATGASTWPEKFSPARLDQLRSEVGASAFKAQYLNNPGTGEDRVLALHPQLSFYSLKNPDLAYRTTPLSSGATLIDWVTTHHQGVIRTVERPFEAAVGRMYRILLADPIRRASAHSDSACVLVLGIERTPEFRDVWRVLDIYLGKPSDTEFLEAIWRLGKKWMVRLVGVESIGIQKMIEDRARQMFSDRSGILDWAPRVLGITYKREFAGPQGKAERIAQLAWRFDFHKIKLPQHLIDQPGWRDLRLQIEDFTEDLALLPHDDALDTLAMAQFVVRPRAAYFSTPNTARPTITELLEAGEHKLPGTTIDITQALNFDELTLDQGTALDALIEKRIIRDAAPSARPRLTPGKLPRITRHARTHLTFGGIV